MLFRSPPCPAPPPTPAPGPPPPPPPPPAVPAHLQALGHGLFLLIVGAFFVWRNVGSTLGLSVPGQWPGSGPSRREAARTLGEGGSSAALQAQAAPSDGASIDEQYLCPPEEQPRASGPRPLAELTAEVSLSSAKPRLPNDITIITQLTFDRLPMLEGQCAQWHSVLSAAVYVPLLRGQAVMVSLNVSEEPQSIPLQAAKQQLRDFHRKSEAEGALAPIVWGVGGRRTGPAGAGAGVRQSSKVASRGHYQQLAACLLRLTRLPLCHPRSPL